MMRTRAAASADSAGAPASGALTVQVSAQSDNLPQRNGLQSAAVATNLIEVGKPEHQGVASAQANGCSCGRRGRRTLARGGGRRAGARHGARILCTRSRWPRVLSQTGVACAKCRALLSLPAPVRQCALAAVLGKLVQSEHPQGARHPSVAMATPGEALRGLWTTRTGLHRMAPVGPTYSTYLGQ